MIQLSAISAAPTGGCTGFILTDNTDYAQDVISNDFNIGRFYLGLRLINIVYPDGTNKIFCTYNAVNDISVQANIDQSYNTTIPDVIPCIPESWNFYSTEQGVFTVSIVSIPLSTYGYTISPISTTFQTGDIVFAFILGQYILYQALVDNPNNNLLDTGEWKQLNILDNFKLVPTTSPLSTPTDFPANYVNTVTITNDCYLTNLECVIENLSCAFCCGKCDDILNNKGAVAIIKASLLVAEIQTSEQAERYSVANTNSGALPRVIQSGNTQPKELISSSTIPYSQSVIQLVCNYSNSIKKLCQCSEHKPCAPCSEDVLNTTSQVILPSQIANAMNAIVNTEFLYNLRLQTTLGKKLCCDDRKTLLVFLVANILSNEQIELSPQSYDCISQTLEIDQSDNSGIITNSVGSLFQNNYSNLLLQGLIQRVP